MNSRKVSSIRNLLSLKIPFSHLFLKIRIFDLPEEKSLPKFKKYSISSSAFKPFSMIPEKYYSFFQVIYEVPD